MTNVNELLERHLGPIAAKLDDLPASIRSATDLSIREMARGVKYVRYVYAQPGVPISAILPGPDPGFAWDLRMVSAVLTGSDSVAVYVGDTGSTGRLIGYAAAPGAAPAQNLAVIGFASHQAIINAGESLFVQTSGAFRFSYVSTAAIQVPAEMLGKVLV